MSTHTEHAENPKTETLKYVATLVVLLILTGITVGASYINFGSGNVVIALVIATIKASIVGLIFMHLLARQASQRRHRRGRLRVPRHLPDVRLHRRR